MSSPQVETITRPRYRRGRARWCSLCERYFQHLSLRSLCGLHVATGPVRSRESSSFLMNRTTVFRSVFSARGLAPKAPLDFRLSPSQTVGGLFVHACARVLPWGSRCLRYQRPRRVSPPQSAVQALSTLWDLCSKGAGRCSRFHLQSRGARCSVFWLFFFILKLETSSSSYYSSSSFNRSLCSLCR